MQRITHHQATQNIKVATDAAIFTVIDKTLHVLLIQMKKKPFTGMWALPGGLIEEDETSEEAASRILEIQTGVGDAYFAPLSVFDAVSRDPLGRVVSIAYVALVPSEKIQLQTTEKYADVRWWPVRRLPTLAYDHRDIVRAAVTCVQKKLSSSNIAWSLLPREFSLSDVQNMYQNILLRAIDKRNFRKKMLSLGLLAKTGNERAGGAHRPAALYRFKTRELTEAEIL